MRLAEPRFGGISSELEEVLIQRLTVEWWEVEGEGVGVVLVFPQELMLLEVVFTQVDKMLGRDRGRTGENLRVYMAA